MMLKRKEMHFGKKKPVQKRDDVNIPIYRRSKLSSVIDLLQ